MRRARAVLRSRFLGVATLIGLVGLSAVGLCGDNVWTSSGNLGSGRVNALAVDPHDPWTVYAATITGIYKTSDGGVTWRRLDAPGAPAGQTEAVAIAPNSTVYAGSCGGGSGYLVRTTDGGSTWTSATAGLVNTCIESLAIDPSNPLRVYAGTNAVGAPIGSSTSGVFRSIDGGATWQRRSSGIGNETVLALAIDPTVTSTLYAGLVLRGVFKSTNNGENWSVKNTGLPTVPNPFVPSVQMPPTVEAIVVDPLDPRTVYAGLFEGVFRSNDGGERWTATTPPTLTNVSDLVLDPSAPLTVYASTLSGGVARSQDGGASWSSFSNGLTELFVTAVAIDRTGTFLYAGAVGALRSEVFSLRIVSSRLRISLPSPRGTPRLVSPRP